jgi:hypothetical protein
MSSEQKTWLDKVGSFEITTYFMEGGRIVIDKVKVLDNNGIYIKFAKLDKVMPLLSQKPVRFKNRIEENPLVKELMDRFDAKPIIKE